MSRISVRSAAAAQLVDEPLWLSGVGRVWCYCDGSQDPVHLHVLEPDADQTLRIAGGATDRLAYVWEGGIEAGGVHLGKGSSFIVERGAELDCISPSDEVRLAVFSTNRSTDPSREGGVHLLPVELVPRVGSGSGGEAGGGLHANGLCGSCSVWLNENNLPGQAERPAPADAIKGVHAHPEDEIIFVTEGRLRLGGRLVARGTALIVAADTLYGFTPGPEGVSFITFRPTATRLIRFAAGGDYAPSTYFDPVKAIPYQAPLARH